MLTLTVYLAFDSLASWLCLAGLRDLQDKCEMNFAPLLTTVTDVVGKPKSGDPLAGYKARRAKAKDAFNEAERRRKCELLGLSPEAGLRAMDRLPPAVGLKWLANNNVEVQRILDYAESVFNAHYRQGRDLASVEAITKLLDATGVSTDGFAEAYESLCAELQQQQEQLLESGMLFSPTFVLEGEIFHGRQHFPLLTWMLTGRKGAPPV